ncbi:MAG TPA: lipoate--protein ligase, partial [Bacilli bacterium]|nr:lipoate--protein ligase [Bacilli bacterium]
DKQVILVKHQNEGHLTPYFYFALEEYLLNEVLQDGETYFFTWVIKGVVIGKNQIIENEVNLDYLKAHKIKLFRRPTGGGTVYADEENTMFSLITKRNEAFSFKSHLSHIVLAMDKLGVKLEFSGRNDLLFDGKKMSGNAFLQNKNGMLLHGTFLYNCDLETMVRAITPSDEKLVSKGISSVRSRVVNLKPFLNGLTQNEVISHLEETLTNKTYVLSEAEVAMLLKRAEKYAAKEFIYRQQAEYTKNVRGRIPGGFFDFKILLKEGYIKNLEITGDFFHLQPLAPLEAAFRGVLYNKPELEKVFQSLPLKEYFLDVDKILFKNLFMEGIIET